MKKRILAALLWFYAGWYAWSVIAWATGLPELAGPVVGAAVAALLAGDPFGRIWGGTRTQPASRSVISGTRAADPA